MGWVEDSLQLVLATCLPHACVLCGGEISEIDEQNSERFCTVCHRYLLASRPVRSCDRCAMPLPAGGQTVSRDDASDADPIEEGRAGCVHCRADKLAYQHSFAFGTYRGGLREAVILAKQANRRVVMQALAAMAVKADRQALLDCRCDLVVPIPSYWLRRLRRRGTPAQVMAEVFAKQLELPSRSFLRRTRSTRKQGTLSVTDRRKNVDGSFALNTGYVFRRDNAALRNRHVLLVDDVLTTGATVNAAATALRRAGADAVTVAVIARATG